MRSLIDDPYCLGSTDRPPQFVFIASEPISETRSEWIGVSPNNMVLITPELPVRVLLIS